VCNKKGIIKDMIIWQGRNYPL